MLKARVFTALALLLGFLAALFFLPPLYWTLLLSLIMLLAAHEWGGLAGYGPKGRVIYVLLTAFILGVFFGLGRSHDFTELPFSNGFYLAAFVFWFALAPAWLRFKWTLRNPVILAVTGWLVLVPTWMAMVEMHEVPHMLLGLMAVVWVADSAAYFAGRRFGKHPLAPEISPKKTWEGVLGAYAGVTVIYLVLWLAVLETPAVSQAPSGLILVWILIALSIEGDLFESWLKRQAGLKDSGSLLPGHGGILDRIDALTSTLPLAALLLSLLFAFMPASG
jgi:phosphatidate cytidylyltransferase